MSTRRGGRRTPARRAPPPSIEQLARTVVDGRRELLAIEDPLEAELWASATLGTFYKLPVPWEVREQLEHAIGPMVVGLAEDRADPGSLALLEAFAAVADPEVAKSARAAADRLTAIGIQRPAWAAELGRARFEGAWLLADMFGDHEGYYATFRYPGRPLHMVNALVDKALGEIVKDASVGRAKGDVRRTLESVSRREPGVSVVAVPAETMSRRVIDAIEGGDLYLDNDWTADFKRTRALLLARMRALPLGPAVEPPEVAEAERDEIVEAFLASSGLASPGAAAGEVVEAIARICLDYTCDYLGDGPYRWSPIVVEQFMVDFVPRKVSLNLRELRELPPILRSWVRFALTRRGLEERWIVETEAAVGQHARAFRREATDPAAFGSAKLIEAAMRADHIDLGDENAIDAWIRGFNSRSQDERDALLGRMTDIEP